MKYVDEFRDRDKAKALVTEIESLVSVIAAGQQRPIHIMEVCGGHTHSIFRYGIEGLLPREIELVHGPGCPVCVLPMGRVDDCVAIAERPGVIFTTFGDAMRVPGSRGSLLQAKANGADVRMVYSPLDALALARNHPMLSSRNTTSGRWWRASSRSMGSSRSGWCLSRSEMDTLRLKINTAA
jgi:hydrogenase expression/formation protein HypD